MKKDELTLFDVNENMNSKLLHLERTFHDTHKRFIQDLNERDRRVEERLGNTLRKNDFESYKSFVSNFQSEISTTLHSLQGNIDKMSSQISSLSQKVRDEKNFKIDVRAEVVKYFESEEGIHFISSRLEEKRISSHKKITHYIDFFTKISPFLLAILALFFFSLNSKDVINYVVSSKETVIELEK